MLQAAQRALDQGGRRTVELALHHAVHEVHDGHLEPLAGQAARGLEAEQAAADDRDAADLAGMLQDLPRILLVRKANTPSRSTPSTGGISGWEPVASTSQS